MRNGMGILPHGRVVVEAVKDLAARDALRQMNDNIAALARKCAELQRAADKTNGGE